MGNTASKKRVIEVLGFDALYGPERTAKEFDIPIETINRYRRRGKQLGIDTSESELINKIKTNYNADELKAIANGGRLVPGQARVPVIEHGKDSATIGVITDTHIGSKYFEPSYLKDALEQFDKDKVDFMVHTGDVTEGMSRREGHIYELSEIGTDAQKEKAVDLFRCWKKPCYMIDGNHDRWAQKTTGVLVVKDICSELGFNYLGQDEGDISLGGKVNVRLFHGEDGNSYATSYRIQKLIESFQGGEKPHILIVGHTHKSMYLFERNVHCFSGGTLQRQTQWMRGKKLQAHTGYWIVKVWYAKSGVTEIEFKFKPFYS